MLFLNKYVSGLYPDSHKKHPLRCNAADVFYVKGGYYLLVKVFVMESHGGLVAYFGGTEILDGAGEYIACVDSPVITLGCEAAERCAFQAHKSFLYHRFHFSVTALHVEHHGDRYAAGKPLN